MLFKVSTNKLDIDNSLLEHIDNQEIKKLFTNFCNKLKLNNFDLVFKSVSKEQIKDLNFRFSGNNYPTDILTFNNDNGADIVISIEIVRENSNKYNTREPDELMTVISHGLLHSIGMDHQNREEQEEFLNIQNYLLASSSIDLTISFEFFDRIKE